MWEDINIEEIIEKKLLYSCKDCNVIIIKNKNKMCICCELYYCDECFEYLNKCKNKRCDKCNTYEDIHGNKQNMLCYICYKKDNE